MHCRSSIIHHQQPTAAAADAESIDAADTDAGTDDSASDTNNNRCMRTFIAETLFTAQRFVGNGFEKLLGMPINRYFTILYATNEQSKL